MHSEDRYELTDEDKRIRAIYNTIKVDYWCYDYKTKEEIFLPRIVNKRLIDFYRVDGRVKFKLSDCWLPFCSSDMKEYDMIIFSKKSIIGRTNHERFVKDKTKKVH